MCVCVCVHVNVNSFFQSLSQRDSFSFLMRDCVNDHCYSLLLRLCARYTELPSYPGRQELKSKWEKMNAKKPLNINWHLKYVHKLTLLLLILWGCLIKENGVSPIVSSLSQNFMTTFNVNILSALQFKRALKKNVRYIMTSLLSSDHLETLFILLESNLNYFFFFFFVLSIHTDHCLAFFLLPLRPEKKKQTQEEMTPWRPVEATHHQIPPVLTAFVDAMLNGFKFTLVRCAISPLPLESTVQLFSSQITPPALTHCCCCCFCKWSRCISSN